MKFGKPYWNISEILSKQRNFMFINGVRRIGKTYTCLGWALKQAIEKNGCQFMYLVRTEKEIQNKAFSNAFDKVTTREYSDFNIEFGSKECWLCDDEGKKIKLLGWCRALSQAVKVKREAFPECNLVIFDEYMLEPKQSRFYVQGWNEPDLLLNIYHTIDRDEDRVKVFLLGNNTAFYNPYHLHPAFKIPAVNPGEIWLGDNVLFQWALPSAELKEEQANSKFGRMIKDTSYGDYALGGNYIGDDISRIMKRRKKSRLLFNIRIGNDTFGVWTSDAGELVISEKHNKNSLPTYSCDEKLLDGEVYARKTYMIGKWMAKKYIYGCVFYESMEVKVKTENFLRRVLY